MRKTTKILFLDAVTTGYKPEKHSIYRLGGIFTENGEEKTRFEYKVGLPKDAYVAEESLMITGETRSGILRYPRYQDVFADFIKLLDKHVNLYDMDDKIHIGGFTASMLEFPFLKQWFIKNGNNDFKNYFHMQTIDISVLANFALLDEDTVRRGANLWATAEKLGITPHISRQYSCLDDARTALDMYHELRVRFHQEEKRDIPELKDVIRNF